MLFSDFSKRYAQIGSTVFGTVLLAAVWIGPVQAQLPAVQQYGNVQFVTGGFGIEESTALKSAMSDYPLVFTFSARSGNRSAYVSKVQVVVRDEYETTVLNVESQGPFLLARLAPGNYQVHVTYNNQTQSRAVTVSDDNTTRLVFEWDGDDVKTADHFERSDQEVKPQFAPGSIPGLD